MNTYIWKTKDNINGKTCLYAGRTRQTVEKRTKRVAYAGPFSRPISGEEIEILYTDEIKNSHVGKLGSYWLFKSEYSEAEQLLINTIHKIQEFYPDRIKTLNYNCAMPKREAKYIKNKINTRALAKILNSLEE
tara:strand:+ start:499 stop:897 length:399 start_codon:yes stop_codon:yes gene_type:complete